MQRREKTETRTLRFTLSLIKKLAKASERMGMTMNEFVVAVLEERVLVDPLIPAFHGMTLDSDIIESFLMSGKVDVLETALSEKAEKNVPLIFKLYESSDMPLERVWKVRLTIALAGSRLRCARLSPRGVATRASCCLSGRVKKKTGVVASIRSAGRWDPGV